MHHILIVEDDLALAEGLCRALTSDDISADYCSTIKGAREQLGKQNYALVILDVNLPDGNGFDFLKELKKEYGIIVILLTANDMEADIVTGLESGAEDYITKPFSLAVLRARVNTQLRRLEQGNASQKEKLDHWLFDFERMEFYYRGEKIELSKTEQKLLKIFMENKEITLSRETLVDYVWGYAEYVDENALSVCVKRLRDKLHAGNYIKTVYGIGYVWRKPNE
ncbi:MAG: response regulator transcription factor [Roseburia sp.]|nr:response regulator transcription factor [Roseburia sp.]MCM1278871.1 response regulator transcription factor [Robinsoniella sp.]